MVAFASFGLLLVALQLVIISAMPPMPQNPGRPSFTDMMHAIHGVWFIYLPITIVGGIIYMVAGYYMRRGSNIARRVAQVNAIAGYVWVITYSISCYQIMDVIGPPPGVLSEFGGAVFQWFSLIAGTLMGAAFPTGLLFILSRPKDQAARIS
jgi:hypothetical protein